ncbi:helicase [Croceibacterium mercuriale]|uniref:site-specific DNA-methyltransferase (adenine-specific) n=1 Tax=Croceibacterium mercuriale TaxID=1572751 RepID=A0A0B2BZ64_9SPHN|nr:type ISP restriction/modification enzyme [Croceibacterium mercuriale]KHL24991.1 helicase [Croceibacterium mercuriale]
MKPELITAIAAYCDDTRKLESLPTTTETTYYPDIKVLLAALLRGERLPFDVRTGTSEARQAGRDMPDFILGDSTLFVGVYGEVKKPNVTLEDLAASTEQNDQIGRYLAQTGVVLISNVRGFGLLTCKIGYHRDPAVPVPPTQRSLEKQVDLWSASPRGRAPVNEADVERLVDIITVAVTDHAAIAAPADLAKILARQARDAKDAIPHNLQPIRPLLDDYRQALGLAFDIDDEKGARFFRSSLVQAIFYSLFAAWVLWDREAEADATFDIAAAEANLPIAFLASLLHDIRHPTRMRHLGLEGHLQRAITTFGRIDRDHFRSRMVFPTIDDDGDALAAITYFYEPFLEAFDPKLRDELGVWYTPPEIVRYQVRRVHQLLKTDLGRARGLADPEVVVLDPCCGTGAYLLEVARCIADQLRAEGDEDTIGLELAKAFEQRVIGFEILTAPFAIAQLQLYLLLDQLGARPAEDRRLAVFLTNALSGWRDEGNVKLNFPEMRDEFDASQRVKRDARIIVVIGNPPYDRFTGAAQAEEAELVAHYKGIELVPDKNKKGEIKIDAFGCPKMKQRGDSLLYREYGVRKQLLDDLYIRFVRMAEERIGGSADYGIVSFISNSSFLTGRSHPLMRHSMLGSFDRVWIDNLNGDKYRTGKIIPSGVPGAGTRDDSVFSTAADPRGIQPGTAVATWLKLVGHRSSTSTTDVQYRDFWGAAARKRGELLAAIGVGLSETPAPPYEAVHPTRETRWRLAPRVLEGGYEAWPALDELFPVTFQGVNHNRGVEGTVVDGEATTLKTRMREYIEAPTFAAAAKINPLLAPEDVDGKPAISGYEPETIWTALHAAGFDERKVKPFLTFPLDTRSIYYDTGTKLLNRSRPEFGMNLAANEFLLTVPEPRKETETRPVFSTILANLHVHERGSVVFPRETTSDDLLGDRDANIAEHVWRSISAAFGLTGRRRDQAARDLVGKLFRVVFAMLYAPAYQAEHKSALASDWAHVPIPRKAKLFDCVVEAGDKVTRLLDTSVDVTALVEEILGIETTRALGPLKRADGSQVRPTDLKVTITYWGGGKGRWTPRAPTIGETPSATIAGLWGEMTGDLYINDEAFFANVPEAVWSYQLGGYPVLKKWLGYRQASRRNDRPLSDSDRRWFRSMIQRIAALLAIGTTLDELYQECIVDAFTSSDLGIER